MGAAPAAAGGATGHTCAAAAPPATVAAIPSSETVPSICVAAHFAVTSGGAGGHSLLNAFAAASSTAAPMIPSLHNPWRGFSLCRCLCGAVCLPVCMYVCLSASLSLSVSLSWLCPSLPGCTLAVRLLSSSTPTATQCHRTPSTGPPPPFGSHTWPWWCCLVGGATVWSLRTPPAPNVAFPVR